MVAQDITARLCVIWDSVAAICGKLPLRCLVRCRCIVNKTVVPRALCKQQCTLQEEYDATCNHCCQVQLKYGKKLMQRMLRLWESETRMQRICSKAKRLWTATINTLSKWKFMRGAMLGATIALWFAVLAGPPTMQSSRFPDNSLPQLASPFARGLDEPYEAVRVRNGQLVELSGL